MSDISIIGLGKLGLPMAALMSSVGHSVVGVDVNPHVLTELGFGRVPLDEPEVQDLFDQRPFSITHDVAAAVARSSITFVIVPTPSGSDGRFRNDYVIDACTDIAAVAKPGHIVVISSTVMPGTCDRVVKPIFDGTGVRVAYSPEFIALGQVIADMRQPDMVLIGADDPDTRAEIRAALEPSWTNEPAVHDMETLDAEIAKIGLNTYVTLKISWANQMGELCERAGADGHAVAEAIGADQRVGVRYLRPAAAYGGPCFPRDTEAFVAFAADHRVDAALARATGLINDRQTQRLGEIVMRMPDRPGARPRRVAVLGMAYKPGTPVTERSAGVDAAAYLATLGFDVVASDPVTDDPGLEGVLWFGHAEDAILDAHVAVIMCPHPEYAELTYPGSVVDSWGIVDPCKVAGHLHRIGAGR